MVALGIAILIVMVVLLVGQFWQHRRARLPAYGQLSALALLLAELMMLGRWEPIATYFTPMAWTCYILLVDAAVLAITKHSRLNDCPLPLFQTAVLSIPLWLIFEAYNLRLTNWMYVGVPKNWTGALLGYGWSFATITPGILETADLIEAFGWFTPGPAVRFSLVAERAMIIFGLICLLVPLVVPQRIAAYLFVLVWIGFVFLLDPINHRLSLPSLLGDLAHGRRSRLWSLLIAGWVCGYLWEFWNYWASAKWHYIFPMFRDWKIFEMPVPGYLGFLPFALECFVMYVTASWILEKAGLWALGPEPMAQPRERQPATADERQPDQL